MNENLIVVNKIHDLNYWRKLFDLW